MSRPDIEIHAAWVVWSRTLSDLSAWQCRLCPVMGEAHNHAAATAAASHHHKDQHAATVAETARRAA